MTDRPLESPRFVIEGQPIAFEAARAWVPVLGGRIEADGWQLLALALIEAGAEGTRRHTLAPSEDPPAQQSGSPPSPVVQVLRSRSEAIWPPADDPDCPLAIQKLAETERQMLLAAVFGRPVRVGQRWRIPLRRAGWKAGDPPIDLGPGLPAFWDIPDP